MKGRVLSAVVAFTSAGFLFSRAAFAGPGVAAAPVRTGGGVPIFTVAPVRSNPQGDLGAVGRIAIQPMGLSEVSALPALPASVVNQISIESWGELETTGVSPDMANGAKTGNQVSRPAFSTVDRSVPGRAVVHQSIAAKMAEVERLRQAADKAKPTDEGFAMFGDRFMAVLNGEERSGSSSMQDALSERSAQNPSGRASLRKVPSGILSKSLSSESGRAVVWVRAPETDIAASSSLQSKGDARAVPPLILRVYKKSLVVSVVPAVGGVTAIDLMARGDALIIGERASVASAGGVVLRDAVAERAVLKSAGSDFDFLTDDAAGSFAEISGSVRGSGAGAVRVLGSRSGIQNVRRATWQGSVRSSYLQDVLAKAKDTTLPLLPPASLVTAFLPFLGLILLLNSRLFV